MPNVEAVVLQMDAKLGAYKAEIAGAATATERELARVQKSATTTEKSLGSMRSGMQQLSYQVGDVATSFALGAKPMTIFAQQGGQVVQALQLMSGGTSGLLRFLGGPWGIAITAAATVLIPLIENIVDAGDESEKTAKEMANLRMISDGLSEAQGPLGEMFDLVTGKLKSQNETLRTNIELMAAKLRAEAAGQQSSSEDALQNFKKGNLGLSTTEKVIGALGISVSGSMERNSAVRSLLQDYQAGKITSSQAEKQASKLDFSGLAINKTDFLNAVSDGISATLKNARADQIEKSLATGVLDPALRKPGTGGGTGGSSRSSRSSGPSIDEIASKQAQAISSLQKQELNARLQLATNADDRAAIEKDLLALEYQDRKAAVENNKTLSVGQKQAQIAILDSLYGVKEATDQQGQIIVEQNKGLLAQEIQRKYNAAVDREEQQLRDDQFQTTRESLQNQLQLADTEQQRKEIALQILAAEDDYLKAKFEAIKQSQAATDADKKRAQLALDTLSATSGQRQEIVGRQYENALSRYARSAKDDQSRVADAAAQKIADLNQTIVDSMTSALGVKDPFLSDLISIFLDRNVFGPLADAFSKQQSGGLFSGIFSAIGSLFGGGNSSLNNLFSGSSWNNFFSSAGIAGARASGGPVTGGLPYLVGERGPEVIVPNTNSLVVPNHQLRMGGGNSAGVATVRLELSGDIDARIQKVSGPVAIEVVKASAPTIITAASNETMRRANRPEL